MTKKKDEGPFEILLREFMAGRMSSQTANVRIRRMIKDGFEAGWEQRMYRHSTDDPLKESWNIYQKSKKACL